MIDSLTVRCSSFDIVRLNRCSEGGSSECHKGEENGLGEMHGDIRGRCVAVSVEARMVE